MGRGKMANAKREKISDLEAFTLWYLAVGMNLIFAISIGVLNVSMGQLYILLTTILSAIYWFKVGRKQESGAW